MEEFEGGKRRGLLTTGEWYNPVNPYSSVIHDDYAIHKRIFITE